MMEGIVDNEVRQFRIIPEGSAVANYGFDVTPARLVTGLITERGVCEATQEGILNLFPERRPVNMSEGSIKFNCIWEQKEIEFPDEIYVQLETARTQLHKLGLIGVYPNGIGYGNISVRNKDGRSFIISGSSTGGFSYLKQSDYAQVTNYSINDNTIYCTGLIKASAESLTHAAVYQSLPEVGAVVHVHCLWLWEKLTKNYPTTSIEIEYGTPAMAEAVGKLASDINGREGKIIVMGGHHEGIVVFGTSLMEATEQIINIYNRFKND